jgi:hypothetical protein
MSHCVVILSEFGRFLSGDISDQYFSRPGAGLQEQTHAFGGNYALVAAISGFVPMMFMTRVRL